MTHIKRINEFIKESAQITVRETKTVDISCIGIQNVEVGENKELTLTVNTNIVFAENQNYKNEYKVNFDIFFPEMECDGVECLNELENDDYMFAAKMTKADFINAMNQNSFLKVYNEVVTKQYPELETYGILIKDIISDRLSDIGVAGL